MSTCLVMFTYPNKGRDLKRLIIVILKKGLAKCVQRVNYMKSYYIREGELKKTEEKLLMCKTTKDKSDALIKCIKQMHPYDVPEILVLDIDDGLPEYLAWLGQEEKIQKKEK